MTVRPLRDGRYVVETDGGTYVVDVDAETCTCPDSAIRGARCKHQRRVDLEIEGGFVPGPNERERVCAVCGRRTFVPIGGADEADPTRVDDTAGGLPVESRPVLCERHRHAAGDLVRDRETGSLLVVVKALGTRADATRTADGTLVAAYGTNAAYGDHEPVFAAVYVDSLRPDDVSSGRRYLFPASRLGSVVERGVAHEQARENGLVRADGASPLLGSVADVTQA